MNNLLNIQLGTLIFSFSKKFDAALQSEQVCFSANQNKRNQISANQCSTE